MTIDVAATIAAVVGGFTPVGAGVGFVWRKIERRFGSIEKSLADCQKQHQAQKTLGDRLMLCLHAVANELHDLNPASPALLMVRRVLGAAYPPGEPPADMIETLDKLS
jgi:hypothetical protein